MDYAQTIDYLYTRLPMFSRIGAAAYKADLDNTIALCQSLGDPQTKFKSIHVAGTNGKGSVSHMLASILQEAGYRTGLYTSPHLRDFRERMRINGNMIPEEFVVQFTRQVQPQIEEIDPSFFELTVAMAFRWFAEEQVDIAVIETGLGGRLDSTNIIRPELSVITNIGFDHMNLLGDTLEKIAVEKAGIIKQHVPVVIGESSEITDPIFRETAAARNAPLFFADQHRKAMNWYWLKRHLIVEVAREGVADHEIYKLDLPGIYQVKNLVTVLESTDRLKHAGWNLRDDHLHRGLEHCRRNTGLHGRWEIISTSPDIIVDVAHNVEGIKALLQQIEVTDHHHLHLVIGMAADKDANAILELLPKTARYYFTQAPIARAMPAMELQSMAGALGLAGKHYKSVNEAIAEARLQSGVKDLIVVCGSIYLAGEVRVN